MRSTIFCCLIILMFFFLTSCESEDQKEERLAHQYCASCHAFPEPALLDKITWENNIMPQMAFRMGFPDMSLIMKIKAEDRMTVMNSLPDNPMVTQEEFERIKNYYKKNAPDSLAPAPSFVAENLKQFSVSKFRLPIHSIPLLTLVKADTLNKKIYLGNRLSKLYQLNYALALEDSFQMDSPPSEMIVDGNTKILSLMGFMDPNDQFKGEIVELTQKTNKTILDSLQRPVHFQKTDINGDELDDYIICAFGNYTGALLAYENLGDGKYRKHVLLNSPGARKVMVEDFDRNGKDDIVVLMAQGDERIILLSNLGNFNFRLTTLLRFPSVYGSSYFELADFNNDGNQDILYTNGDNGDFSPIFKPYHGVRVFLNDGTNQFKESWFHSMYGASQARVRDFDQDGDVDIVAISFFPDFKHHPEHGLLYFENTPNGFKTFASPLGASGRWITLEADDIDEDGDCDVLLGSLNFEAGIPSQILDQWFHEKTSLLILRNNLHKK